MNAQDGWAGGAAGIYATADGGASWTVEQSSPAAAEQIDFAGAQDGWVLGPGDVL